VDVRHIRLVNVKIKTGKSDPFRRTMARAECFGVDSNRGSGRLHHVNNSIYVGPPKILICFLFKK